MQVRLFLLLVPLLLAGDTFGQNDALSASTNPPSAGNAAAQPAVTQRYRRTNESARVPATVPSFPAFPQVNRRARTNAAPVTTITGSTTPLATNTPRIITTQQPTNAIVTNAARALPAGVVTGAIQGAAGTVTTLPPASGVAVPVPGTTRTAIPIPGTGTSTQVSTNKPAENPEEAEETGPATSPLNPAFSPTERIEAASVNLVGMPIDQFFDVYSMYSGRTVLRPYALPAPQGLTLKSQTDLTRLEVVQAMDAVLALNGVTMIPVGDKFVKAVPSNIAATEGMDISKAPLSELPNTEQFLTRIVKLKTAKPSELAPILQGMAKTPTGVTAIDSNQTLILRDYSSNIRRMLEVIEKVDVLPVSDFQLEVIPIKYGKVMDIYSTMSALISGNGGGAVGGTTGSTLGSSLNRPGGFGGAGGFGGGSRFGGSGYNQFGGSSMFNNNSYNRGGYGGGYYPQDIDLQRVSPQQVAPGASPGAAQSSFQQRLNQIVNRAAGGPDQVKILENAQIVPDERSNKLLIFSNKRDMSMITNIVSKLDVMLAQVLIEAVILEVKLGDTMKLGVSVAQNPKSFGRDFQGAGAINNGNFASGLTNFPAGSPNGFSYFGTVKDDFNVAINALATDNQINIISRPRIQTSHAIPGSFFIGETVPYVTGVYGYGGLVGGGLTTQSQVQEKDIGLSLTVTPFITPEGMVVMEIDEQIQQRGQDVIIDNNPIPLVNTRAAQAVLTVRDGDIIMLGGFITESRSKNKSGIPFLKDIPGLGVLFRNSSKDTERTELILLMKATVLDTPESAAFLAQKERLQLPGVRQAEHEFEQSDNKRLKEVEREIKK